MYDHEKSDFAIVAGKPTNKAGATAAEPVEPRGGDREECGRAKHTPDFEPGSCDTGVANREKNSEFRNS